MAPITLNINELQRQLSHFCNRSKFQENGPTVIWLIKGFKRNKSCCYYTINKMILNPINPLKLQLLGTCNIKKKSDFNTLTQHQSFKTTIQLSNLTTMLIIVKSIWYSIYSFLMSRSMYLQVQSSKTKQFAYMLQNNIIEAKTKWKICHLLCQTNHIHVSSW